MIHSSYTIAGAVVLAALLTVSMTLPMPAAALTPQDRVENFRLLDHKGASHELYYYSDMQAVVIMAQANACETVQTAVPLLEALAADDVQVLLLNSSLADNRSAISAELEALDSALPVLLDDTQIIGESMDLSRAGEVFVLDPKTWSVVYAGHAAGAGNAVESLVAGAEVEDAVGVVEGCAVDYPHQSERAQHADISYADEIAPMLADNCVACHREGGIGPWAMNDYNMVRGFSLMIREVVRTQRMPPWHADPAYGHFSNDRSLSADQVQTLVHWIEAGAPRGEGSDPLADYEHDWPLWDGAREMGPPDLVINIPAAEIPATGVVDYLYQHVENPLDEDVWVKASEILPGDRAVLHHVITRFGEMHTEGPRKGRMKREGGGGLAGYVPGYVTRPLPDGTGTLLPANATIQFQMHYTTNGRSTVDESKMGIWFHKEPPENEISGLVWINPRIRIPAHSKNHSESATLTVRQDAVLYNLLPHAHFRGKASNFVALYPDGSEEMLLSVPNYDFNWQTTYILAEPKFIPAGTKIVHTTWWDNSGQNPANPDPSREVPWGQQSWDEMLFGAASLRYLSEAESAAYRAGELELAEAD
ncbi:MAG: hypothetical protein AAGE43_15190 [Pseudomonadota bacterium]